MQSKGKWFRNRAIAAAGTIALAVGVFAGLAPLDGVASSHREAPLVAADPQVDNTDVYAFVSRNKPNTVTLLSSWIPFEEPAGGPNFYLWAEHVNYDINIDNNGDAKPDVTYRWVFTTHYRSGDTFLYNTGQVTSLDDPDLNIFQTYDLTRVKAGVQTTLVNDAVSVPSNVGAASMPNYNSDLFDAGSVKFGDSSQVWAGQSDDPFFLDLRVFDLLYGANFSEAGDDTLAGFNVNTLALRVPKKAVANGGKPVANPIIGIWSTASRPSMRVQDVNTGAQTFSGPDVQVSRLGSPLVNELVVPVGSKDFFNASHPDGDGQFLPKVEDPELPHLINAVYGLPVPDSQPATPGIQRDDLVQVFLTGVPGLNSPSGVTPSEMLRLNMMTPLCGRDGVPACSTLGVLGGDLQGFPNGRRLSDDIVDEALRVAEGVLLPGHDAAVDTLGDGVDANDVEFNDEFPYVAYPSSGSDPSPH